MRRIAAIVFLILILFQAFSQEELKLVSLRNETNAGEIKESSCCSDTLGTPRSIRGFSGFFSYSRLQFNQLATRDISPTPDSDEKWLSLWHSYFLRQNKICSPFDIGLPLVLLPRADG